MVERNKEDLCKVKRIECAVLLLMEQKERLLKMFLIEARNSFDKASTAYYEDEEMVQKEIDSLSKNCSDCPYNSKSLAIELKNFFEKTSHK